MHVRQGHKGGQLLQEFPRCQPNPRGAIGPEMGEGVDEITVRIFLEALQRHRTACGIGDELSLLVSPMRRNRRAGVEGKPIDIGAVRPSEPGRLALRAKA